MAVGIGYRSFFGLGEESTYGTSVARSHYVEINSESLAVTEPTIKTNSLFRRGYKNILVAQGGVSVAGDIEFDAMYGGWLKLAKHAFGRIDTSVPDPTSNATVKRHKFTIVNTLPTGLTLEVFRDTTDLVTEPSKSYLYTGCKLNSMRFAGAVDEILKVTCGVIGRQEGRVAKSSESFAAEKLAVYHQGKLDWGSDELAVEEFEIALENGLDLRPRFNSRFTREPIPNSKVAVNGSFTTEFDSWAQYDDFRNATERRLLVTFTGDVITGSYSKYIELDCKIGRIVAARCVLNSPGRVMMEIDFEAYRDETNNELILTAQNTEQGL